MKRQDTALEKARDAKARMSCLCGDAIKGNPEELFEFIRNTKEFSSNQRDQLIALIGELLDEIASSRKEKPKRGRPQLQDITPQRLAAFLVSIGKDIWLYGHHGRKNVDPIVTKYLIKRASEIVCSDYSINSNLTHESVASALKYKLSGAELSIANSEYMSAGSLMARVINEMPNQKPQNK